MRGIYCKNWRRPDVGDDPSPFPPPSIAAIDRLDTYKLEQLDIDTPQP